MPMTVLIPIPKPLPHIQMTVLVPIPNPPLHIPMTVLIPDAGDGGRE